MMRWPWSQPEHDEQAQAAERARARELRRRTEQITEQANLLLDRLERVMAEHQSMLPRGGSSSPKT